MPHYRADDAQWSRPCKGQCEHHKQIRDDQARIHNERGIPANQADPGAGDPHSSSPSPRPIANADRTSHLGPSRRIAASSLRSGHRVFPLKYNRDCGRLRQPDRHNHSYGDAMAYRRAQIAGPAPSGPARRDSKAALRAGIRKRRATATGTTPASSDALNASYGTTWRPWRATNCSLRPSRWRPEGPPCDKNERAI
jgi:hypothetical protein